MRLNPMMAMRLTAALGLAVSLLGAPALAQTTPAQAPPAQPPQQTSALPAATAPPASPDDPDGLPIDLSRMRKLLQPGPAKITDAKVKFTMEVIAHQPTMKNFVAEGESLRYGPVRGAMMTHQDFLDMVNPKLLNSSAGFTATETLQAALFNWAVQSAVKKGVTALKNARDEAEVRAIRAQIDRELAALRGGGQ